MSRYGLGIDVGDQTIAVAVCPIDEGELLAEPLPLGGHLGTAPAALRVDGDGGVTPARSAAHGIGNGLVEHVLGRVGDPTPLQGPDRPLNAAELIAGVVAALQQAAETAQGEAPAWTVLAVPPSWREHRRAELAAALAAVVGDGCTVASSALAATRHHRATSPSRNGGAVAVYDLGASTVDTAVVRTADDGSLEHAAMPPAPWVWGGRDVDDAVLEHVRGAVRLPAETLAAGRERLTALRRACVRAKETLSSEPVARVDVDLPGESGSIRMVRADLEELIADAVADSVGAVRAALADARLEPGDLDGVLLAGGGVLVPLVSETLSAQLQVPLFMTDRPALTVACGAAELAADQVLARDAVGDDADGQTDDEPAAIPVRHAVRAHRRRERSRDRLARRSLARAGVVAAMLAVLLGVPLTAIAVLDGLVTTRNVPGVAEAVEIPAPAPAPSPAPVSPAANVSDTGPAAAPTERSGPARTSSPTKGRTTGRTTAPATTAAAAAVAAAVQPVPAPLAAPVPAVVTPVVVPPPVETTPPPTPTPDPPAPTTDPPPPTPDPPAPTPEPPPPVTNNDPVGTTG